MSVRTPAGRGTFSAGVCEVRVCHDRSSALRHHRCWPPSLLMPCQQPSSNRSSSGCLGVRQGAEVADHHASRRGSTHRVARDVMLGHVQLAGHPALLSDSPSRHPPSTLSSRLLSALVPAALVRRTAAATTPRRTARTLGPRLEHQRLVLRASPPRRRWVPVRPGRAGRDLRSQPGFEDIIAIESSSPRSSSVARAPPPLALAGTRQRQRQPQAAR